MKTYSEKLRDPRWQRRRLEIMRRNDFCCESCGDGESTLNVHHKRYIKGRAPWEYDDDDLTVVCESCHELEHEAKTQLEELLAATDGMWMDWNTLIAIVGGYLHEQAPHYSNVLNARLDAAMECDEKAFAVAAGMTKMIHDSRRRENLGKT